MSGLLNSASAISAAFFIDCATVPALPPADIGRISPTLTAPAPMVAPDWGGAPAAVPRFIGSEMLEHAAKIASTPASNPPTQARRGRGIEACKPAAMAGLLG